MIEIKDKLLKKLIELNHWIKASEYVVLQKDDEGFYIEYAFLPGAPHDNRCLSWYDSYQPGAYTRNNWNGLNDPDVSEEHKRKFLDKLLQDRLNRVGKIFRLSAFTCDYEGREESKLEEAKESWEEYHPGEPFVPEDHICKVGCPAKRCKNGWAKHWTYKEPVKCACWHLWEEVTLDELKNSCFSLKYEDIKKLLEDGNSEK